MGKASKQLKNREIRIAKNKFSIGEMKIRRESDNKVITINPQQDEHWQKRLEVFCQCTNGYIAEVGK